MKTIDTRLSDEERAILASMVGHRLDEFRCDEFHFNPSVYQIVGLYVDESPYVIENATQVLDYFGDVDDVAVISVRRSKPDEIFSHIVGGTLVSIPVGQTIRDVLIYEDTQIMSDGTKDLYSYSFTKAIVFDLLHRKLVFERDAWFSEDIFIYRGQSAEEKISSPKDDLEESGKYMFRAERSIVSVKNLFKEPSGN